MFEFSSRESFAAWRENILNEEGEAEENLTQRRKDAEKKRKNKRMRELHHRSGIEESCLSFLRVNLLRLCGFVRQDALNEEGEAEENLAQSRKDAKKEKKTNG